jgi:hypothetical protein
MCAREGFGCGLEGDEEKARAAEIDLVGGDAGEELAERLVEFALGCGKGEVECLAGDTAGAASHKRRAGLAMRRRAGW